MATKPKMRSDVIAAHLQKYLSGKDQKEMNKTSMNNLTHNKAHCERCCKVTLHVIRKAKVSKKSVTFYRPVPKGMHHQCPESCAAAQSFDTWMKPVYTVLEKIKKHSYFEVSIQNKPERDEELFYALNVPEDEPFWKLAVVGDQSNTPDELVRTFDFPHQDKAKFLEYLFKRAYIPVVVTLKGFSPNAEPEYVQGILRLSVKNICNPKLKLGHKKRSRSRSKSPKTRTASPRKKHQTDDYDL
jgi:hypothetical protein